MATSSSATATFGRAAAAAEELYDDHSLPSILCVDFLSSGGELVVIERPLLDVLANYPLRSSAKYGVS